MPAKAARNWKAAKPGRKVVGYMPIYVPRELIHAAGMLAADDFNFGHDVFGIYRHLDRTTGKLMNCFVPRFAQRQSAAA